MSSILIKGMDMPKGCDQCRCCVPDDVNSDSASYYCALNNHIAWNTEHNIPDSIEVGCPLVEIPTPHGDLIDRNSLLKEFEADPEDDQKMREESLKNYILMTKIVDIVTKNINEMPVIIKAEE